VRGGRPPVRDILFVVASVAGRYEPDLMAFRQRLAAQGKPPKVIRIALAHKLLVRLNAKARDVRRQLEIFPAAEQLPSNPQCST
jgi:transposase